MVARTAAITTQAAAVTIDFTVFFIACMKLVLAQKYVQEMAIKSVFSAIQ